MIFRVQDDVFAAGAARDAQRVSFWHWAGERHHTVQLVPSNAPHFTAWLAGLPTRLRREIEALREGLAPVSPHATSHARSNAVVTVSAREPTVWPPAPGGKVGLRDAICLASRPVGVLVEHAVNDRGFLLRVMPAEWRRKLETAEREGRLRFENGGGISVMRTLVEAFATNQSWRYTHFVVSDHDGDAPATPSTDSLRLEKACKAARVDYHRLERRSQESYLPREALEHWMRGKMGEEDRTRLQPALDAHFCSANRRHEKLPRLGEEDLFKNLFMDPSIPWEDAWFTECEAEMTGLAEQLAAAL